MNEYKITEAKFDEASELARLHIDAERQTYASTIPGFLNCVSEFSGRTHMWRSVLSEKLTCNDFLVVRHASGILIGFLSGSMLKDTTNARLNGIYVLKEHQNRGVGQRLFFRYIHKIHLHGMKNVTCILPKENLQGREFFAWCGGLEVGHKSVFSSGFEIEMLEIMWNNVKELAYYSNLTSP